MTEEYTEQLFLQEKPTLALLAINSLKKTYASVITKEINSTFAHTTKILSKMEEHGLVKFTVEGRVKYVELTEHGIKTVDSMKNMMDELIGNSGRENKNPFGQFFSQPSVSLSPDAIPLSQTIQEKIDNLRSKIERIYIIESESGADKETLYRKLGPFNRDIKIIANLIESSKDQIDESVIMSHRDVTRRLGSIINK
ncbi:MAG: MarR family transcriptional regulator [Methanosarcinaceae archaeon]|nr:MarR family transcriptional regulator [Methanosarcinaceae archaeon]